MRTIAIIATLALTAAAAQAEPVSIGTASIVTGKVQVSHLENRAKWVPLTPGAYVFQGDRVKTLEGNAKLTFADKSSISVARNSEVELNEFVYKPSTERRSMFKLWGGEMRASISKFLVGKNSVKVSTPTAVAGVRGTEFVVGYDASADAAKPDDKKQEPGEVAGGEPEAETAGNGETKVVVISGQVGVKNILEQVTNEVVLNSGQGTSVIGSGGPSGAVNLAAADLRARSQPTSVRDRGTPRNTVTGGVMRAASVGLGGGGIDLESGFESAIPPINQQSSDANEPVSLTIHVKVPGTK